jgi:CheY-like chemotaxis protein
VGKIRDILLVDDDAEDHEFFKEALIEVAPHIGFHWAGHGKHALKYLVDCLILPDLIFLDLNMPVMNGYEMMRYLLKSQQFNSINVGIITTSNAAIDIRMCKELGAKFYLTKPTGFVAMCAILNQILNTDFDNVEFSIII